MKGAPVSAGVGLKHFVTCFERCAAVRQNEGGHVYVDTHRISAAFILKAVTGEYRGGLSEVEGVMPSEVLLLSFI